MNKYKEFKICLMKKVD
ncbi:hypothetical protein [Clostridium butyricum]